MLIEGKVDWKGRTASKNNHGGMRAAFAILGKSNSCLYKRVCIYIN